MMKTAYYSINNIKAFFNKNIFKVGNCIETTLNHPNGTYFKIGYKIISLNKGGAECFLLYKYGNFGNNKETSYYFKKENMRTFIDKDFYKHFYKII